MSENKCQVCLINIDHTAINAQRSIQGLPFYDFEELGWICVGCHPYQNDIAEYHRTNPWQDLTCCDRCHMPYLLSGCSSYTNCDECYNEYQMRLGAIDGDLDYDDDDLTPPALTRETTNVHDLYMGYHSY